MSHVLLARVAVTDFRASTGFDVPIRTRLRPAHVFSTASVEPARQFEAWQAQCGPVIGLLPPPETATGYRAHVTAWKFGAFALVSASADAAAFRREQAQIRRDAIDHWVIRVARRGTQRLRTPGGDAVLRPGLPCVLSLGAAFEGERGNLDWVSLIMPRDMFPGLASTLDRSLHQPLDSSLGLLLAGYLETLEAQLSKLTEVELPRLVSATRAIVAACIPAAPAAEVSPLLLDHARLERVRKAIRQNLRSPSLTPKRLARMVGMSRSQLYRLFEPMGGVARYIQAQRLREAHRALSDPDNLRDIHEVAEDLGFFDASTFSRTFRRAFGGTPTEVRAAALAGYGAQPVRLNPAVGPIDSLTTLLRTLQ